MRGHLASARRENSPYALLRSDGSAGAGPSSAWTSVQREKQSGAYLRKLSTVLSMVSVDGSWRFGEESRSTVSLLPRLVALAWPTFCPLVRLSIGSGGIVDCFAASRAAMGNSARPASCVVRSSRIAPRTVLTGLNFAGLGSDGEGSHRGEHGGAVRANNVGPAAELVHVAPRHAVHGHEASVDCAAAVSFGTFGVSPSLPEARVPEIMKCSRYILQIPVVQGGAIPHTDRVVLEFQHLDAFVLQQVARALQHQGIVPFCVNTQQIDAIDPVSRSKLVERDHLRDCHGGCRRTG
eukprot:scaffold38486_cov75-Phaeocystis_antarctica.AAC.4